ncbi:MAG TPA: DUF4231 domain-containing protein [Ktedonobacteraceae bacterium]|nr:DUF4231 domain-containing protein [Ktedonobacteraceae bacterium]
MDEMQDKQESAGSSATDDTASNLPAIGKQIQPTLPLQQQNNTYQNSSDPWEWGNTQQFPPPPPNTQRDYRLPPFQPPSPSAPTDYERRPQPTPIAYDYERPVNTVQYGLIQYASPQTPLQQYKDYVKFRIQFSSQKALRLRWIHNILQTVILVGAALVSISIGFPHIPAWLPPLISGVVTIATAITSYYKFGERSRDLYRSAEDMQREYNWFKSKRGPYKTLTDEGAFELFQDKIDSLKREQFLRTYAFDEQKEEQKEK